MGCTHSRDRDKQSDDEQSSDCDQQSDCDQWSVRAQADGRTRPRSKLFVAFALPPGNDPPKCIWVSSGYQGVFHGAVPPERREHICALIDKWRDRANWCVLDAPDGTIVAIRKTHVTTLCLTIFCGETRLSVYCYDRSAHNPRLSGISLCEMHEQTVVWFVRQWDESRGPVQPIGPF